MSADRDRGIRRQKQKRAKDNKRQARQAAPGAAKPAATITAKAKASSTRPA